MKAEEAALEVSLHLWCANNLQITNKPRTFYDSFVSSAGEVVGLVTREGGQYKITRNVYNSRGKLVSLNNVMYVNRLTQVIDYLGQRTFSGNCYDLKNHLIYNCDLIREEDEEGDTFLHDYPDTDKLMEAIHAYPKRWTGGHGFKKKNK